MTANAILGEAATGYRALYRYLGTLALIGNVVILAYSILLVLALGSWGLVGVAVVGSVGMSWLVGLLVQSIDDLRDGGADTWIGARWRRFWPRVNALSLTWLIAGSPLILAQVLAAKGRNAAALLLLLVWLALATRWVLAIPLVTIEELAPQAALARSNGLVRGHGLQVLATLLLTGLVAVGISIVCRLACRIVFDSVTTETIVATFVSQSLFLPFSALVLTVLYHELLDRERASVETHAVAPA